jgi:hypothetical protein
VITGFSNNTLTGTAEPNSRIQVFQDGVALPDFFADAAGSWSLPLSLSPGNYTFTATATDSANNTSALSSPFAVDTLAPNAPVIVGFDRPSNVLTGTAEAASTVEVFLDGTSQGTTTTDANGAWSFTYTGPPLSQGNFTFTATAKDTAGNTSPVSSPFVVDALAPNAPLITSFDQPTNVLTGTAEAGSTVEVFLDGGSQGTTTTDANGAWTFTYTGPALSPGAHTFTATATDAAGNESVASADFNITIA